MQERQSLFFALHIMVACLLFSIAQRKVVRELSTTSSQHRNVDSIDHEVSKPVERQVEARSSEDAAGSIVRSLYFADTFLTSGNSKSFGSC